MKCISCKTKTWLLIKELHVHAIEIPHKTSKYISPCNDVLYRIYLSDMLKKMEFFLSKDKFFTCNVKRIRSYLIAINFLKKSI